MKPIANHMERQVEDAYSHHWTDQALQKFLSLLLRKLAKEYAMRANGSMAQRCLEAADHLDDDVNVYTSSALEKGRPEHPCSCEECDCHLHAYDEDGLCVWCEEGDHGGST